MYSTEGWIILGFSYFTGLFVGLWCESALSIFSKSNYWMVHAFSQYPRSAAVWFVAFVLFSYFFFPKVQMSRVCFVVRPGVPWLSPTYGKPLKRRQFASSQTYFNCGRSPSLGILAVQTYAEHLCVKVLPSWHPFSSPPQTNGEEPAADQTKMEPEAKDEVNRKL